MARYGAVCRSQDGALRMLARRRIDLIEGECEAAAVVGVARIEAGVGLLAARGLVAHAAGCEGEARRKLGTGGRQHHGP